jgi:ABC-type uncharacterized transport system fused permease/ATPase subunit
MDAIHKPGPTNDQNRLLGRFWRTARKFWSGRYGWVAWNLTIFLVLIVLVQLLVQYLLNYWNRVFFDALERRDSEVLWQQAWLFVPLAMASTVLAAVSVWGRMTTQRKWRESVLRRIAEYWLSKDRFRRVDYFGSGSENPEYRISQDVRIATDAPIDMVMAFLASVLTAITFLSILWNIGGNLTFEAFATTWVVPGYLVIGVITYSGLFSALMIVLGRDLTGVIERQVQSEAELRAAADALYRDNNHNHSESYGNRTAESHGNGTAERRTFWLAVHDVLEWWRNLCWQLVRTTLVSHGNTLLAPVVAWILCVPKFLAGTMSLGELTQAAAAFVTVQGAFNWLVDNYQRLADWRAAVHRVATLLVALDALDDLEVSEPPASPEAGDAMSLAPRLEPATSERRAAGALSTPE